MRTANKLFSYDKKYLNESLDKHARVVHSILVKKCEWNSKTMLCGMYGYDALIMSIGYAFDFCPDKLSVNCLAEYIHQGWSDNYLYWRKHKPWVSDKRYKKPHNSLDDDRRNKLALTKFDDLPKAEKKSNIVIAKYILKLLTPKTTLYSIDACLENNI